MLPLHQSGSPHPESNRIFASTNRAHHLLCFGGTIKPTRRFELLSPPYQGGALPIELCGRDETQDSTCNFPYEHGRTLGFVSRLVRTCTIRRSLNHTADSEPLSSYPRRTAQVASPSRALSAMPGFPDWTCVRAVPPALIPPVS